MLATVVDVGALLRVVWVSLAAGIGFSLAFSVTIAGAARAGQERRSGRTGPALVWTVLATACALLCAVGVVLGVAVMLQKG